MVTMWCDNQLACVHELAQRQLWLHTTVALHTPHRTADGLCTCPLLTGIAGGCEQYDLLRLKQALLGWPSATHHRLLKRDSFAEDGRLTALAEVPEVPVKIRLET